jgi:hypothetical protein
MDIMKGLLNRKPKWLIVMRIVVTHAPQRTIATSGLYGLLGDAPVQIIDVADRDRIDGLYALSEQCEDTNTVPTQ